MIDLKILDKYSDKYNYYSYDELIEMIDRMIDRMLEGE